MFGHQSRVQNAVQNTLQQTIQNTLQNATLQNTVQNAVQNHFQAQNRPSLTAQQQSSFTLASLVEGQTFNSFPRQSSYNENSINQTDQAQAIAAGAYRGHDSWQDSWGSENPTALPTDGRAGYERSNSRTSTDSWGVEDPMPLPYQEEEEAAAADYAHIDRLFSTANHNQLMSVLGVEGGDASQKAAAAAEIAAKTDNKRPSVKFQLQPQRTSLSGMSSAMSLTSHLSELSIFSDALSLDSAMDAVQREAEFEMLGEFEAGEMSIGTFESSGSGDGQKPRRSILRKSNKWTTTGAAYSPAALTHHADPGMIFTSTLDTKPGGINCGTDISGLMGERRKSAVAFEVSVNRRRSSRMSMCSALTDFSDRYKRDFGSVLSIQSAEFRDLMADIDDEDDSSIEEEEENSP